MSITINPTVGRVVWFYDGSTAQPGPYAAIVAFVHDPRMVNLAVFDANGVPCWRTSVPLVQDGDERPHGPYCEWMPYQKGQAAKTEALEKQIAGA